VLTFGAPAWLLGLALLPLVRWLHRRGRPQRALVVSRAALWRAATAANLPGRERRPPDPAWRRRALLCALLLVALAAPQVGLRHDSITLWVDDSLSMLTREANGTRLNDGMAKAQALLAGLSGADVAIRTLGRPWRDLGEQPAGAAATIAGEAGSTDPRPPPGALLQADRRHWLVTDGAHPSLLAWGDAHRPDRVIRVGAVGRNAGLERLSARRSLVDTGTIDLLAKVTNGGTEREARDIAFVTSAGVVRSSSVVLAPGASVLVRASIGDSTRVVATLQPHDALPDDDELALDLRPLRKRPVAVDPACGAPIAAAIAAHPALARVDPGSVAVDAILDCGGRVGGIDAAVVRVRHDRVATPAQGTARWAASIPESRRVVLPPGRMRIAAHLERNAGDEVLLAIGDEPVVVRRRGSSGIVETSLDLASAERTRRPEVPLIVNLMLEQLLDERLLDGVVVADRGAGAAHVAPSALPGAAAQSSSAPARQAHPASSPLLLAALLVLFWELLALWRQWRRLRPALSAEAS
jgi:hypothetical protein